MGGAVPGRIDKDALKEKEPRIIYQIGQTSSGLSREWWLGYRHEEIETIPNRVKGIRNIWRPYSRVVWRTWWVFVLVWTIDCVKGVTGRMGWKGSLMCMFGQELHCFVQAMESLNFFLESKWHDQNVPWENWSFNCAKQIRTRKGSCEILVES